jgi:hypothetical protein
MNRAFLKENDYLMTTGDILAAMADSEGLGVKTKNYTRVVMGIASGQSVLEILKNPASVGVPTNQLRYFKAFVASHKLADRIYPPTRKSVHVGTAEIEKMKRLNDGRIISLIDYTDMYNYSVVSESALSEAFASADLQDIKYYPAGRKPFVRHLLKMHEILYVNLFVEHPDEDQLAGLSVKYRTEVLEKIQLAEDVVRDGFWIKDEHGQIKHAVFLFQTPSQARLMQGIFILEDFMKPEDALELLGFPALAFAKKKGKTYELDVTKMLKRPGLAGTNTVASKVIRIGSAVVEVLPIPNEYMLTGGTHNLVIANDRQVVIKKGHYRKFNTDTHRFEVFDAAKYPVKMTAADGAVFFDEKVYYELAAEFGKFVDAVQVRITPFVKGLAVFIPGLKKYYPEADIVAFRGSCKGDFRQLLASHPDFKIEFRVAIFNKKLKQEKKYTEIPYQFIQTSSVTAEDLIEIVKPHLNNVYKALYNTDAMKKLIGLDRSFDDLSDEEQDFLSDRSMVSTFARFLSASPLAFNDVYMKKYAVDLLKRKLFNWKTGSIPVEGHYRYMIQDPYAVLACGTEYKSDDLVIRERPSDIKANEVFLLSNSEKKSDLFGKYVVLGRNPAITEGELQYVKVYGNGLYMQAVKHGAFQNLCVMSVHDFCTFGMGGADNDGDECMTITEPRFVAAVGRYNALPLLDMSFKRDKEGHVIDLGDGCPYSMELAGVYQLPAGLVEHQDSYRLTFTAQQAKSSVFKKELHELGKDYVIRTLAPNKIATSTNMATILADSVRGMKRTIQRTDIDKTAVQHNLQKIDEYCYDIDLLRLVQGWEIDRAKHGGFYEEAMKDTLSFMKNPPKELSKEKKGSSFRVWMKPDWLALRQDPEQEKDGINRNGVLSRVMAFIQQFETEYLDERFAEFEANAAKYSLLAPITSSFDLKPDDFLALERIVGKVKARYGAAARSIFQAEETEKQRVISSGMSYSTTRNELDRLEQHRKDELSVLRGQAQEVMANLALKYPARDLGFVAYYITYAGRKQDSSLSFPWTVCADQFIQTLAYMEHKPEQDQILRGQIVTTNVSLGMCVPSKINYTREQVATGLAKHGGYLLARGDHYLVFIHNIPVGYLYNSKKTNHLLMGHDKYSFVVVSAELAAGRHTLNLNISQIVKY